jgi:murein DD-endopeptidase MepM/ murein hydrolase activator NlpD/peptidoglycan hydrolase-like protein with peptidoglycan-binding domain
MSNLESIISSFHIQENLNPKIWELPKEKFMGDPEGQHYTMRPKVRERLLEIAYEFIEFVKVDFIVSDVVMTGSLANYNWSKYSDIDLHIMADFSQFNERERELYQELFTLKKTLFNDKHDIKIFGYDTELYIQDENEEHTSTGVYSVLFNKWIEEPSHEKVIVDRETVKNKSEKWMKEIDTILENIKDESVEDAKKILKKIKDKIKKYRKSGLEEKGEFSIENLVFKVLRRNNYIQKIFDFENDYIDKTLSLSEATLGSPLDNLKLSSKFGEKRSYENHPGVDLATNSGSEVKSPADGDILEAEFKPNSCGGTLFIKHPNGFKTRYCHIKEFKVNKGDVVKQGQVVALSGGASSDKGAGNSRGAHLHFEVYKDGSLVDPMDYIDDLGQIKSTVNSPQTEKDKRIEKLIELGEKSVFLFNLMKILLSGKEFRNVSTKKGIPYDEDVEYLQTALQLTGNLLPKFGVDGLFGPETENSVKQFQKSVNLPETGMLKNDDLKYLYAKLLQKGFTDSDLSKVQKSSEVLKYDIKKDEDFYVSILKLLEAPVSDENLKFLKAWRQAEGGIANNNPFNTTMNLPKDDKISNYNSIGVKNYSTPNFGVEATVRTLSLPYYKCIVDGLKNDIGAQKISECPDMMVWSTGKSESSKGKYVNKVLQGNLNPKPIEIKDLS